MRRDAALRMLPLLAPVHYLAPAARRGQLLIAAALCALVSLGVAPHAGCGVACWAAEACGGLYAGFAALLILDGALEAASVTVLCAPWRWLDADDALPPPLLRQLALFALGLASLFVHPYFILLSAIDLLPAIPRCRAILTPLAKAAPPVLAIAALAAALALPASAAARAAGAAAECAAGDAVACAVQALATVAPASAAALAMPRSVAVDPEGAGDGDGDGAGDGVEGAAASHLGSQLGPLVLLGLGALLLQLGVAVLVDALADERGRTSVAREYASEHCLVCGASRAALDKLGPHAFSGHVRGVHAPEKYARLLAAVYALPAGERSDDDAWLVQCAQRGDGAFLPSASREYWDPVVPAGAAPLGWRPQGWDAGGAAALGWKLEPEPSTAQLRAAVEQLAVDSAKCWAALREQARRSRASDAEGAPHADGAGGGGGGGAAVSAFDWRAVGERLSALERASQQQSDLAARANGEAARLTTEVQMRIGNVQDNSSTIAELIKLVRASCATIDTLKVEVDALRKVTPTDAPPGRAPSDRDYALPSSTAVARGSGPYQQGRATTVPAVLSEAFRA